MDGIDRWVWFEEPHLSMSSGVTSHFIDDPPEELPESRPLLGFTNITD